MTPAEIGSALGDNWLFVLAIVFFLWFVTTKLLETSKAAADLAGPIGRWVRSRQELRDKRHKEEVRREAKRLLLDDEIRKAVEPEDYQQLKDRVTNCTNELTETRIERNALRAYVIEDEEWHFDDSLLAIREKRDPRTRLSWEEFFSKYRQGWRPDTS